MVGHTQRTGRRRPSQEHAPRFANGHRLRRARQAIAFKALLGIDRLRLYDIDRSASEKCARNLAGKGFDIIICATGQDAVEGVDIITTVTADNLCATILTDNMVGSDDPDEPRDLFGMLLRAALQPAS